MLGRARSSERKLELEDRRVLIVLTQRERKEMGLELSVGV